MRDGVFEARLRPLTAEAVRHDVAGDRVKEREERAARLVPRHRNEGPLEHLARHVLGLRIGAHAVERVAVDGLDVEVVERAERTPVARARAARQVLFIHRFIGQRALFVEVLRSGLRAPNVGAAEVLGPRPVRTSYTGRFQTPRGGSR